ncbi:hypothetical protein ARALYDRAFT_905904 [Arabidopsis lyrata subsp. lyrata]|uniref:Jacalin-type lectin domain-containing protein n=1 Tax=Arabidopsis lyrata subsp. lyrata TaxID=81972 RepID=D7LN69_ARALL|nr:hypothetical protein ARALYDRAFT_905904 [Arabidopsis lyrata subsp. lyrata]
MWHIGQDNSRITYLEFEYEKGGKLETRHHGVKQERSLKGRTSFSGYKGGKKFKLEQKGRKLVGFHGKDGSAIDALGAYFGHIPTPTPIIAAKKLPAIGGNGGVFVLEDGEYLTAIDGYYDKIFGVETPMIICLQFKTNKRESTPFGMDSGEKFSIGEIGHKIVGCHGQASDVVHSIGVTVVPITTTK